MYIVEFNEGVYVYFRFKGDDYCGVVIILRPCKYLKNQARYEVISKALSNEQRIFLLPSSFNCVALGRQPQIA